MDMNSFSEGMGKIRIVIVGGWSPGPLNHLKRVLCSEQRQQQQQLQQGIRNNNHNHNNNCYEIIEPRNLNLWMPPFPGLWCCHPFVVITALMLGMTIFAAVITTKFFGKLIFWLLALFGGRCLVGVAVQTSIKRSIGDIQREMELERPDSQNEPNKVLLIGFSWGGAIVAEMIANGLVGDNDRVSALLIAPTTSWVGRLACGGDAATRIATSGITNGTTAQSQTQTQLLSTNTTKQITVVHGQYDTAFCPHQSRWRNIQGVDLRILPDNHVFLSPRSLQELERILLGYTTR